MGRRVTQLEQEQAFSWESHPYNLIATRVKASVTPTSTLLDLGCGPGLYCQRFARRGLTVTGLDLSAGSLAYARDVARKDGLAIEYIEANYLTLDVVESFEAVVMIYHDFSVLPDDGRDELLRRVRRALKPGGVFIVTCPHDDQIPDSEHVRIWGHDELFHLLSQYSDTVSFKHFPPLYFHVWMLAYVTKGGGLEIRSRVGRFQ